MEISTRSSSKALGDWTWSIEWTNPIDMQKVKHETQIGKTKHILKD